MKTYTNKYHTEEIHIYEPGDAYEAPGVGNLGPVPQDTLILHLVKHRVDRYTKKPVVLEQVLYLSPEQKTNIEIELGLRGYRAH